MKITYDRDKDLVNIGKHGVSLAEAEFLDWENALIWFDDREDYGEDREISGGNGERSFLCGLRGKKRWNANH